MIDDWKPLINVEIFRGLEETELMKVAMFLTCVAATPGEVIVIEGDTGDDMYVVMEGTARVVKSQREVLLDNLKSFDCFGELALIDTIPRSASIEALENMTLYRLSREGLGEIKNWSTETYATILLNIAKIVSRRLRILDEIYAEFGVTVQKKNCP